MMSCASGGVCQAAELGGDRGRPRPVDQDRNAARSAAIRKIGSSRSSFRRNFCARGWSLMPRAPRSRSTPADRLLGEVEPDEGDEQPVRALGGRERPVVRGPERRMAIGLVEAERERSLRRPPREAQELVERRDEPVDVPADVDVRVEDVGSVGNEPPHLLLVLREETASALVDVFRHETETTPLSADRRAERVRPPVVERLSLARPVRAPAVEPRACVDEHELDTTYLSPERKDLAVVAGRPEGEEVSSAHPSA